MYTNIIMLVMLKGITTQFQIQSNQSSNLEFISIFWLHMNRIWSILQHKSSNTKWSVIHITF